eukprot:737067_1
MSVPQKSLSVESTGRETKNEANKRKEGIKSRLKSGELRLLKLKRPQAYIGLAHNIAEKDNDEAGLPVYLPYRKCTKCWMIYSKGSSAQTFKTHHAKEHGASQNAAKEST